MKPQEGEELEPEAGGEEGQGDDPGGHHEEPPTELGCEPSDGHLRLVRIRPPVGLFVAHHRPGQGYQRNDH